MNNENNDDFLPGVGPINDDNTSATPQNFDQNISNPNPFNMNMESNQFDPNMNAGFDPNANLGFDPNMNNNFDPNANVGFDPNMNNSFDSNANVGFDPNMNNSFDPNANLGFDPNANLNYDQNQFDPNMGQVPFDMNQPTMDPNMGQVPFDMNQPTVDPNMGQMPFDMNQPTMDSNMDANFDPNNMNNNFDPNANAGFDPNMNNNFDPNANLNYDQNQFDYNMGQVPFDMNQPTMAPNMNANFDPSMNNNFDPNANLGFDPNMNNNFDPNANLGFDPNMNNNFDPNANLEFDPNMNNGFEQNQFSPEINSNYDQASSSDYNEDFERNWMGQIYDKAHSKKFNFCAAFFGPAYLFYRKVYLTGGLTTLILIIINIILSLLKLTNIGLILGINAAIMLIYFLGLGFGFYPIYKDFVHKQFNKYKNQITDNNQLVAIASKKGGTSILALIVYYIATAVVSTVMVYSIFASLIAGINKKLPQANITGNNTITNNSVFTEADDSEESFVFAEGYSIKYPDSTWVVGADNKSLVKGAYTLSHTVTYQPSDLGVTNMTSAEGRDTILTIINNSVTNLAATNNLQMDSNDNFVASNDVGSSAYYTYINLSSATEITRYYFVIVPTEEKLFQFELKINDTNIDPDTHIEVVKMLTNITSATDDDLSSDNTVQTTNTNELVDNNSVSSNSTTENNTVTNEVSNNVISENNTTSVNNTTSSVSNVLRNTSI